MNLSALQLKHYSFFEFWVKQNPHADIASIMENQKDALPNFDGVKITPTLRTVDGEITSEKAIYFLTLSVIGTTESGSTFPYEFGAEVLAQFELNLAPKFDDPRKVAAINGASMLYGIIRDQLLTLTSRCVHGPILLPTADFRSFAQKQKQTIESKATGTSKIAKKGSGRRKTKVPT